MTFFKSAIPCLQKAAQRAFKDIFKNQCIFCLDHSNNVVCQLCTEALPKLSTQCPRCAEPNHHGEVCGHCIKQPPAFDKVICPFVYSGPVQSLVANFKNAARSKGSDLLTDTLNTTITEYDFDLVIPIPYHWKRLLQRGHNPVRELAITISREQGTPMKDALVRTQHSSNQKQLNRQQRLSNLHGAFTLHSKKAKALVANKNILLIDDVLTTGATCNSAALTLKQAGAKSITVACLARTPAHT